MPSEYIHPYITAAENFSAAQQEINAYDLAIKAIIENEEYSESMVSALATMLNKKEAAVCFRNDAEEAMKEFEKEEQE